MDSKKQGCPCSPSGPSGPFKILFAHSAKVPVRSFSIPSFCFFPFFCWFLSQTVDEPLAATARMRECLRATQGLSAKNRALKPCVPRVKRHKTTQKTCGYHGHSALCQTTKKGVKRGKKIAMPCDCRSPAGKPWQKISKIFPQKSGEIFETFCHNF